jgi:chromosome segregation ATPase
MTDLSLPAIAELRASEKEGLQLLLQQTAGECLSDWAQRTLRRLAELLPQLLSAAERGIAAGEEAAPEYVKDLEDEVSSLKGDLEEVRAELQEWRAHYYEDTKRLEREKNKAEADLAASNARIGELEAKLTALRAAFNRHPGRALLTPTHQETERTGSLSSSSQTEGEG